MYYIRGLVLIVQRFILHKYFVPERKDKIEDGNKVLIQKFQSQLTQQLDFLHKTVAASATQQEQQLKAMEEDMNCFVSTKTEVFSDKFQINPVFTF